MTDIEKRSQAKLFPSELVTLGLLYALKGVGERAFHRFGAEADLMPLFPLLPERTRLFRLLSVHQEWTKRFLADPTAPDPRARETKLPRLASPPKASPTTAGP